jgi:cell division protein FtsL
MSAGSVFDEAQRRRSTTIVGCLALLGATLAALGHVGVHARQVEVAAALGREQVRHRDLLDRRRQLVIEISRLKDPARLEREARTRLGMEYPLPNNIRNEAAPAGSGPAERRLAPRGGRQP